MGHLLHGIPSLFGNQQLHVILRISSKLLCLALFKRSYLLFPKRGKIDNKIVIPTEIGNTSNSSSRLHQNYNIENLKIVRKT